MSDLNRLYDALLLHGDIVKRPDRNGEALAWCPWHADKGSKNANLGINAKKKIVNCFSCGNGGHYKLAKVWGIELPDEDGRRRIAPEATVDADDAMLLLFEAYRLTEQTTEHFQIKPSPKRASTDRRKTGAWSYPTKAGMRFKAFDRTSKPKYWWGKNTKKEARQNTLYGLEEVPEGAEVVYLVNGEPAVWVCWQAGVAAVCGFGESNLQKDSIQHLVDRGTKHVRIVLDCDNAGVQASIRDVAMIRGAGLEASVGQLPPELGDKGDVCDLYLWHKADDRDFEKALRSLPDRQLPDPDQLAGTRFFERDGRFYKKQSTRGVETDVPLTNFVAYAVSETIVDDGSEQTLNITLRGQLDTGLPLTEVSIPAKQVHGLDWIADKWGYAPMILSGRGNKEDLREIMQRVSLGRGLNRRTIYSHTGWRRIDGDWRYLMPGGAVGVEGIEVELQEPYRRYQLPEDPGDAQEAVRASFRMLDVATHRVTFPMLAYAYLAPLQSILTPGFSIWIRANSGSFKSTLTALLMSHFGEFSFNTPPVTWEATSNAIGRYLFDLKDCLGWIDDFNPRQSDRDMNIQYTKADTVLRSIGNTQGRARMKADLTLARSFVPRSMLVSTGEIYPVGESVIARTLALDFSRSDIDLAALTRAQEEAHLYPCAMTAFVLWLGERYDKFGKELPEHQREIRGRLTSEANGQHARIPGTIAALQVAVDVLAQFGCDVGAFTQAEMETFQDEAMAILHELSAQQTNLLLDEDIVDRWFNAIDALLVQGRATFHQKGTDTTTAHGVDLLGWFDEEYVYLQPDASYDAVVRWYRNGGRNFGASETSLRSALAERGVLLKNQQGAHRTMKTRVNGRQHRVLQLHMDKIPFADYFEHKMGQ